jgi:16S rRNA pseudouridine516 synthase
VGKAPPPPKLDDLLARNLGCSRAEARRLLTAREIRAEPPAAALDPKATLGPEKLPLPLIVQGQRRELHHRIHLALHKPAGYLTALRDARHPVAHALLREAPLHRELRPVGRLDLDTTGLLLWTNDGPWLQRLAHPKRALPRGYQAALARPYRPPTGTLTLADGHRPNILELVPLSAAELHPGLLRPPEATAHVRITIAGGAYHEVRRIFAALGSHVLALCRVSFGRLALRPDLPAGGFHLISAGEVEPEAR